MILTYLIPIIAITVVVTFHELGHLIVAKLLKVSVEVFSIGIGKKLFKFNFKGTEYAISAIPLGGYCKLKGGDPNNPSKDLDSADLAHPLKKVLIYGAGPLFNFIITVIFLININLLPIHQQLPAIIYPAVGQELPGELGGLLKGDIILSINNKKIDSFQEISTYIKNSEPLDLLIDRDGTILNKTLIPKQLGNRYIIGVNPLIPLKVLNTPLEGISPGDEIIKIGTSEVDNLVDLYNLIENGGELTLLRGDLTFSVQITAKEINRFEFTPRESKNFFEAISQGFKDTFHYTKSIVGYLGSLIKKGEIGSNISSPIRLVYDVGNSFSSSILNDSIVFTLHKFLITMASISITLGIINLLPIPILDGGQILINSLTFIKGSKFNPKVIYYYQVFGLLIILLLFILGFGNDILYLGEKI